MPDRPTALLGTPGADLAGALDATPVPNLRRIGGEMFAWSDRDPRRGPAAPGGALLRFLLGGLGGPGRTALIAGPHCDDLVAALVDGGTTVTWLLRSLADAEHAARTHPAVTVLCGGATRLDTAGGFDLVVAADGLDRLNSAEGEQASSPRLLNRLAGALRPDGALLLVHDNLFGAHRTVALQPGARDSHDSSWYPADEHDEQRPASLPQLVERLAAGDLDVRAAYAVFPEPAAPTVLLGHHLIGDVSSPLRPQLSAVLSAAFGAAFRGRPVLSDPRRLMTRALRAGAEGAVAAAWLTVARPCGSVRSATDQHDLLVGDVAGTFAYEVAIDGSQLRTTVLAPLPEPVERAGLRRVATPLTVAVDGGYVLEERLLHLCATADLRRLRAELSRFDGWLREQAADGVVSGPLALVEVADVLVNGGGLAQFPARWEPVAPVPLQTVAVRAMWQFAVQLITTGHSHPWPVTSSAVDLTAILLGMVGRGLTDDDVRAAVESVVAVEAAEYGMSLPERHERVLRLLAVTPGTAPVDVPGYRELEEALWRQRYQAGHLLAMMDWTEQMIASRDLAVSQLDLEVQFYRRSWAGRLVLAGRTGYQLLKRDGRNLVRTALRRSGGARTG